MEERGTGTAWDRDSVPLRPWHRWRMTTCNLPSAGLMYGAAPGRQHEPVVPLCTGSPSGKPHTEGSDLSPVRRRAPGAEEPGSRLGSGPARPSRTAVPGSPSGPVRCRAVPSRWQRAGGAPHRNLAAARPRARPQFGQRRRLPPPGAHPPQPAGGIASSAPRGAAARGFPQ